MSQKIGKRSSKSYSWIIKGTTGWLALSLSGLPAIAADVAKDLSALGEIPQVVVSEEKYSFPGEDLDLDQAQAPLASSPQEMEKGIKDLKKWPINEMYEYASLSIEAGTALAASLCSFAGPIYERTLPANLRAADENRNNFDLPGFQRQEASYEDLTPDEKQQVLNFVLSQVNDSFIFVPVNRKKAISSGTVLTYSDRVQYTQIGNYDVDPFKVRNGGESLPQELPGYETILLPDVIGCKTGTDSDSAVSKVCQTLKGSPLKAGSSAEKLMRPDAQERKRLAELFNASRDPNAEPKKYVPSFGIGFFNNYNPKNQAQLPFSSRLNPDFLGFTYGETAPQNEVTLQFDQASQRSQISKDARIASAWITRDAAGIFYSAESIAPNYGKLSVLLPIWVSQNISLSGKGGGTLRSNFKGAQKFLPPYSTKMLEALKFDDSKDGWRNSAYSPFVGYDFSQVSQFSLGASYVCVGLPGSGRSLSYFSKVGLSRKSLLDAARRLYEKTVQGVIQDANSDYGVLGQLRKLKRTCDRSSNPLSQALRDFNANRPSGLADSIKTASMTDQESARSMQAQQKLYVDQLEALGSGMSEADPNWQSTLDQRASAWQALSSISYLSGLFAQKENACQKPYGQGLKLFRSIPGIALNIDAAQRAIQNLVTSLDGDSGNLYDADYLKLMRASATNQNVPFPPQNKTPPSAPKPELRVSTKGNCAPDGKKSGKVSFTIENTVPDSELTLSRIQLVSNSGSLISNNLPQEGQKVLPGKPLSFEVTCKVIESNFENLQGEVKISSNGGDFAKAFSWRLSRPGFEVQFNGNCSNQKVGDPPALIQVTVSNPVPNSVLTLEAVESPQPSSLTLNNAPSANTEVTSEKSVQFSASCSTARSGSFRGALRIRAKESIQREFWKNYSWRIRR